MNYIQNFWLDNDGNKCSIFLSFYMQVKAAQRERVKEHKERKGEHIYTYI